VKKVFFIVSLISCMNAIAYNGNGYNDYAILQKPGEAEELEQQQQELTKPLSTAAYVWGYAREFLEGLAYGLGTNLAQHSMRSPYKDHGRKIATGIAAVYLFNKEGNLSLLDDRSFLKKGLNATGFIIGYFGQKFLGNNTIPNQNQIYNLNGTLKGKYNEMDDQNLVNFVGTYKPSNNK
jgi:hypothetical protein